MEVAAQQTISYPAMALDATQKEQLALLTLGSKHSISELAEENEVSRQFLHRQKNKALEGVKAAFDPPKDSAEKILFNLPVTTSWLRQLTISLSLDCKSSYRGIQSVLENCFDQTLSLGSVHNIIEDAKDKAKTINHSEDLSQIKLGAQDEMFHHNKPMLTGIDIPSLYCYLLVDEEQRDFETWGMHLLDLKEQGLNPERIIGDDAAPLQAAHKYVFQNAPYDLDNFHILQDLMDLRRYFRNRLKTAISERIKFENKVEQRLFDRNLNDYTKPLEESRKTELNICELSKSIDTLVNWMRHDVLNMPGVPPETRHELYGFILGEFEMLAERHPHRIKAICTTLKNQQLQLLAFTEVLNEKFETIADNFIYPIEKIWEMCNLQRCENGSDQYAIRSIPLQDYFQYDFDEIEDAVIDALKTTERTSSMVENLHSRLRPYCYLRQEIGFGYLDLLRFYLNHTPINRSAKKARVGKTPAHILMDKQHPHWLEMLGYQRFKKAA